MLMEKAKGIGVGSKGRRLQNESGWGGATKKEVRRKKHIGTQIVDVDGKSKRNRSR